MKLYEAKQALRKEIASLKKLYKEATLQELSSKIMSRLEESILFQKASCKVWSGMVNFRCNFVFNGGNYETWYYL